MIDEKLKQLKIEDLIWLIYIVIIFLSWYSNELERKYFLFNDLISKKKYRYIMIFIFTILVLVYSYFLYDSYKSIKNIDQNVSYETKKLNFLSFVSSLLIFISGLILLYIAYRDTDLSVEIAFN
jgi:uncharacterized membrane protein YhaH (DUF805 family)